MGYTNYWKAKDKNPKPEILTKELREDIRKVVAVANGLVIDGALNDCVIEEGNDFISVSSNNYNSESFYLDLGECHPKDAKFGFNSFCFCKTYETPFDEVVKCCIAVCIKHGIFEPEMSFDGDFTDKAYSNAIELAKACGIGIDEILKSFMEA